MSEKWSEAAWKEITPIYESILRLPFIEELSAGVLPIEKFLYYLGQDAQYLSRYTRVLAHVASRLSDKSQIADVLSFASTGLAVEAALHESYLRGAELPAMSPTCLMYTAVEEAQAYEPVAVEAAALLPCFWVYQRVGEAILSKCKNLDVNPYARWIRTYADEVFAKSTRRYIEICDALATESLRDKMTEVFINCTRLEWMFWDSAYNLEKWKV